jgi:hypothetical protein
MSAERRCMPPALGQSTAEEASLLGIQKAALVTHIRRTCPPCTARSFTTYRNGSPARPGRVGIRVNRVDSRRGVRGGRAARTACRIRVVRQGELSARRRDRGRHEQQARMSSITRARPASSYGRRTACPPRCNLAGRSSPHSDHQRREERHESGPGCRLNELNQPTTFGSCSSQDRSAVACRHDNSLRTLSDFIRIAHKSVVTSGW